MCSCWSYRSREPEERSRWQFCRPFFSSVSPFLPATHAITALRASIAGYSGHEYADAMWFLASFILFAAFLGLALRPLLVRGNRRMVAKLESTKLL